jgi:hypothetical protein
MKQNFCEKCRTRPACDKVCGFVATELRGKGVYDTDPDTGELRPTKKRGKAPANHREIDIIYFSDPYNDNPPRG